MTKNNIILTLSILCMALIITTSMVSNRATKFKRKIWHNYVELDSVLHVARMQNFEIESLKIYATQTKYYELLYDSLSKDNQYLEEVFTSNYKRVKLLHKLRHDDYTKYQQNILLLDSIYALNQITLPDTIIIIKDSIISTPKKDGFFKNLFKKKKK